MLLQFFYPSFEKQRDQPKQFQSFKNLFNRMMRRQSFNGGGMLLVKKAALNCLQSILNRNGLNGAIRHALPEPEKANRRPNEQHDTGEQQSAKHLQGLVVDRGNHGGPT
jgi:hypothetical protein